MICPNCKTEGSVTMFARIMIDSDERSRNYSSWLRCQQCGSCYYGATEEYYFDDDFIFSLYQAENPFWERTLNEALRCPRKDDDDCQCVAHTHPSEKNGKLISYTPTYYLDYK